MNEGTVVTASDKAALAKEDIKEKILRQKREQEQSEIDQLCLGDSLEWTRLTPQAQILYIRSKRYYVSDKDGSAYISMKAVDAMGMVGYAMEKKLSVLGNDIYPLFKRIDGEWRVTNFGVSSEARARVAKNEGVSFGPPHYKDVTRPWPRNSFNSKPFWTEEDIGIECTINMYVGAVSEPCVFTAWLSEWYMGKPEDKGRRSFWDKNPSWMLMVRAKDKAITLGSGVGQSDPQQDDVPEIQVVPPRPQVVSTEFKEVPIKTQKEN
jgi:hypothetical protein